MGLAHLVHPVFGGNFIRTILTSEGKNLLRNF
jgi:hypothetical protein